MSKKRWTRYIAFILTAFMLISAVPVGAKADTDKPEEAISEEAAATSDGANAPASSAETAPSAGTEDTVAPKAAESEETVEPGEAAGKPNEAAAEAPADVPEAPADAPEAPADAPETEEAESDQTAGYYVAVTGGKAYVLKDGQMTETDTAEAGDNILLVYDSPAEGEYFTEWVSDQVSPESDGQFVMPDGNVTVIALFEEQTPYCIDLTGGSFKSKPEDEEAVLCFLYSQEESEKDFVGERAYDLDKDGKEDIKASFDETERTAEFILLETTGLKGENPVDCTNMPYSVSVKFPEADKADEETGKPSEDASEEGKTELTTNVGDLTVSVTSDQAFPADAMLYASIIQDPARVTKIEEEVSKAIDKGAAEEVLALDIGIYLNGEELDLEEDSYSVSITSKQYAEKVGKDGKLYHFETDENSPVQEESAELKDNTLTFSTTHFSVFAWVKISAGTGEELYGCWDPEQKGITFSRTKPEEPYEEVNSLKEFIRSHTDAVFVDFACDGGKIKAADCAGLFAEFTDLESVQNLGNLDTSSCRDFSRMFYKCSSLQSIDLTGIDTSKATNMAYMFCYCSSIKTLDVHPLDTASVENMYCMMAYMRSLEEIDLSSFKTESVGWVYGNTYGMAGLLYCNSSLLSADLSGLNDRTRARLLVNVLTGCTKLERLVLGNNPRLSVGDQGLPAIWGLDGNWAAEEDTSMVYTADDLYVKYDPQTMAGVWIRVPDDEDRHFYRTDGSLDGTNLWEVHDPDSPFKGYCLNLNRTGVGTYLDRVTANTDDEILALLCTSEEGSTHGYAPLGSNMREAMITLIYYGWPNDAAGIQAKYGLTHDSYMNITQQAIWDFTDRYDGKAGPSLFSGDELAAYNELLSQTYAGIGQDYELYLYSSWNPSRQNLLSLMSITDRIYGGVEVLKTGNDGGPLSGAEFTVYAENDDTEIGTMTTRASGKASICRTDTYMGLPEGKYYVKETKAPAGYQLSNDTFYFSIKENNVIVCMGRRNGSETEEPIVFTDEKDESYKGGGVMIQKLGDNNETLENAVFTIYDENGKPVKNIRTNASGIARTGKQDLPLGTYTIKETKAPAGYLLNDEEKEFTLTEDGQYYSEVLTFTDVGKKGSIVLKAKKYVKNGDLAAGDFRFELQTKDGATLQIAENDADGNVKFKEITYGPESLGYVNYRIVEIAEDDEHISYDRHVETVTVTITDKGEGENELSCLAVYDADGASFTNDLNAQKYKVYFRKYILNKALVLPGAILEIRDVAGRVIKRWTSEETEYEAELYPGVYRLYEASAPSGYAIATPITFTVEEDGTVSCSAAGALDGNTITMTDQLMDSGAFTVFKTDSEGAMLEGAVFRLKGTDELDQEVDAVSVTDDKGQATFSGLLSGTYTLREEQAPEGYLPCHEEWTVEIKHTKAIAHSSNVNDDGSADRNYPSKANEMRNVALENADNIHLRLVYQTEDGCDFIYIQKDGETQKTDANGKSIGNKWSNGAISGGLGKQELITEEYDFEGNALTFRLTSDANTEGYGYYAVISHTDIVVKDSDGNTVDLKDGLLPIENEMVTAKVNKVDIADEKALSGATLQVLDKDGRVVEEWVSDGKDHEIKGLIIGETYTLHEETAPDGYTAAADETFSIDENGEVTYSGMMKDGVMLVEDKKKDEKSFSVRVNKVDVDDGKALSGAKLQILDKDGKVVEEWVSDGKAHEIKGLNSGETYTLHEVTAPDGYTVAQDETFSIDENGEVTYSGTMAEDGTLLLKDKKVTEDEKTSSKDSGSYDNTGTGDNSHTVLWTTILLMACAALLLTVKRVKKT